MNDEQRKAALELLNELVEMYEQAIIRTAKGNHAEALMAHTEALVHGAKLKWLLTSPTPAPTSTIWVGLAPATMERLLATNAEFGRQYEERSKDCGRPFIKRNEIVIELMRTELGLGLGVKLFTFGERITMLDLPTILVGVERAKEDFARAMETLGVPDTKDLLKVLVKTT